MHIAFECARENKARQSNGYCIIKSQGLLRQKEHFLENQQTTVTPRLLFLLLFVRIKLVCFKNSATTSSLLSADNGAFSWSFFNVMASGGLYSPIYITIHSPY